jgi:hypothetical protein
MFACEFMSARKLRLSALRVNAFVQLLIDENYRRAASQARSDPPRSRSLP